MCPCTTNILASLAVRAKPFWKTIVCNLLLKMSSTVKSKMFSNWAASSRIPVLFKCPSNSSVSTWTWSGEKPNKYLASLLYFLTKVSAFQISFLFFKPYLDINLFSVLILSAFQGWGGVLYFFLAFLGCPIITSPSLD